MSPKRKPKEVEETPVPKPESVPVGERFYERFGEGDMQVIIGPHEGFVDTLGLAPETATRLHNILHRRKLYNYKMASSHPQEVVGAIQELYLLDAQKLLEAFYRFEQEIIEGG